MKPVNALIVVALLALSIPVPAQATQGGWNQWRGPARDGQCPGPVWPANLDEKTLTKSWSVPLGASYSGPVVDAERVYTTETLEKSKEVVTAFDRVTGKKIWSVEWEGAMTVPFFAAKNGSWIRSTPALFDGRLYVCGMRDVLACLDAKTGKVLFKVDFVEKLKGDIQSFGFVCSPMIHGNAVYVQTHAGFLKLDRLTGEILWHGLKESGGMMGGAFSSPVFATLAGKEQLVVQTREALKGVDDQTGEELWGIPIRTFRAMNILTPTLVGDGVFTSAYGGQGHFFDITKSEDGFAVTTRWSNRAQGYMSSPVVVSDHGYIHLRSKRFACVELKTGEIKWFSEPTGNEYWSLIAQGDRLLALTDGGELLMIRANPEKYEEISRRRVAEGNTWAHLAVDGGQVFVRELGALTAFSWKPVQ